MMATYLAKVTKESQCFNKFDLYQIIREENEHIDALSKLASTKDAYLCKWFP